MLLWMDQIRSRHFETMVETVVGIYRQNIIPGFLRWCEMEVVHPHV